MAEMGSGYCKQVVREGAENLGESVPLLREQQVRSSPGGRGQCGWSRAEQVKGKVVPDEVRLETGARSQGAFEISRKESRFLSQVC